MTRLERSKRLLALAEAQLRVEEVRRRHRQLAYHGTHSKLAALDVFLANGAGAGAGSLILEMYGRRRRLSDDLRRQELELKANAQELARLQRQYETAYERFKSETSRYCQNLDRMRADEIVVRSIVGDWIRPPQD